MSKPGWLKLYNQTLDSDFWVDPAPFSHRDAFFHVLMSANWRKGVTHIHGHKYTIERGQWLTSIRKLEHTFHWSRDRVYKWLQIMKDYDMLQSENVGFGTLLTVVNYGKFQNSADSQQDTQQDSQQDSKQNTQQDSQQDSKQNTQQDSQQDSNRNSQQDSQPIQSKTIDIRQENETEDSGFNHIAPSGPFASGSELVVDPDGGQSDNPDDTEDDEGMTWEEARRYWESLQ